MSEILQHNWRVLRDGDVAKLGDVAPRERVNCGTVAVGLALQFC